VSNMRRDENYRESWWVQNNTNKTITIGDLLLLPALEPGKRVDLLRFYSREKVSHSKVLVKLVKCGIVSLNKKKIFDGDDHISISDIDKAITPAEENEIEEGTTTTAATTTTSPVLRAFCSEDAPEDNIINCYLDSYGSGIPVPVVCSIVGDNPSADEVLSLSTPRLERRDEISVVLIDGIYYCTTIFSLTTDITDSISPTSTTIYRAFCAEDAPAGNVILCYLDSYGSGSMVSVVCNIVGQINVLTDGGLNSSVPRLKNRDEIIVVLLDGVYYCTALFNLSMILDLSTLHR
jgi:hypothetical protein